MISRRSDVGVVDTTSRRSNKEISYFLASRRAGELITQSYATAQSEWMTTDFVPFEASLEFTIDKEQAGVLVLEKDNPSGLPEHSDEIRVPVILK